MGEFFRTNLFYRIVSLLLAISLWAYVTANQNPIKENLYEIPLESRSLSSDLMVANKPTSVNVRVQSRTSLLENYTTRDYLAYVNLSEAEIGDNVMPVQVNSPAGIEVVGIDPALVSIKIDQTTQRQSPVRPIINGETPANYLILEPSISPTEVLLSGPKSILDQVADVVVEVDLRGKKESYLEKLPIIVYDADGKSLLDWVKIQPSTVEVFLPIVRDLPAKTLVLKPVLTGLKSDKKVKQVVIQPELAELYGRWEVLDKYDYIYTRPIDLSEVDDVLIVDAELDIPEGTYLGISTQVKIVIEMEKE